METDQIWIKSNPKNPVNNPRNYGQFFMDESAPNYKEKLEMSYRTMGR